jgi:alkylation response protein AidB-like acyl-CoA dehydrogenase
MSPMRDDKQEASMATDAPCFSPAMPLVPNDEERMLRETVREICAGFGPEYSRRKTDAGEPPRELWEALASRGYMGVDLPEEYGGGGSACPGSRRSAKRSPPPAVRCC